MDSTIMGALIGAAGGAIGVIATALVGRAGLRSTEKISTAGIAAAQEESLRALDAERDNRLWDKRAEAYVDMIAEIARRVNVRERRMTTMISAASEEPLPAPADRSALRARMIAFASQPVFEAMEAARDAGNLHRGLFEQWSVMIGQERDANEARAQGVPMPARASSGLEAARQAADEALKKANRLDAALIMAIRGELHRMPGTGTPAGWTFRPDKPGAARRTPQPGRPAPDRASDERPGRTG